MKQFFILLSALVFLGCEYGADEKPQIKIAVSNWVGYTPLIYAYQKGMLRELNIKIVPTTSLTASLEFTKNNLVEALCATQMEYESLKGKVATVIVFDRSFGGDMVLSNLPKDQLYGLKETNLSVYLEYNTINNLVWRYFKKSREWDNIDFILKNNTQSFIANLQFDTPSIVVTYHPYASTHIKNGLHEIMTSKEDELLIIDGLFVTKESLGRDRGRYEELKKIIKSSLVALHNDPKEYYQTIHKYLEGQSYDAFVQSLHDIQWMVDINETQKNILHSQGVDMGDLL